jgi:tripartite ATP-independent transporter DctM subunit
VGDYFLPIMMMLGLIAGIFAGYPVALLLAGLGILFSFFGGINIMFLGTVVGRIFSGTLSNWLLLAVPLFIFMGLMLDKSDAARKLLISLERLFAGMRGGLAIAVTLLGIVMAASTGIVGASVVLLGLLSLPVMLKQKYDKSLALGLICGAGTLGILIPPSIMLVLVGDILGISVGDLFMGALVPGVLLGAMYIVYILAIALFFPEKAPAGVVDVDDKRPLWLALAADLVAPVLLIMAVLGSIIMGVATPTEAAGIGALGTMVIAAFSGQLSWKNVKECVYETSKTTSMILWVAIAATCFSVIFKRIGGDTMVKDAVLGLSSGPFMTLFIIMSLIFLLGFFLEWIEISYIVLPLFAPIVLALDFGLGLTSSETLVWFAILVAICLQTSFLTPPFGYALFYLKGITPPDISMGDIYKAIIPFVILQLIGLSIAFAFPNMVLWLPRLVLGG